jgi:hypothetical protein
LEIQLGRGGGAAWQYLVMAPHRFCGNRIAIVLCEDERKLAAEIRPASGALLPRADEVIE